MAQPTQEQTQLHLAASRYANERKASHVASHGPDYDVEGHIWLASYEGFKAGHRALAFIDDPAPMTPEGTVPEGFSPRV